MTTHAVRVRYAPSPTGFFHVGGARTALHTWLFARHHGGRFILRIEDTDRTRYSPESLPDLLEGLRWLGLWWDEGPEIGGEYGPYYQSDRVHLYQQYAQRLLDEGLAYRCYCTRERLAALRKQQHGNGQSVGYDRHCRHLTQKQIADYEAQGIRPTVRLAVPLEGEIGFDDVLRGRIVVQNKQLDDLILLKSDGFPTYHLGVVVDDHLMEISHVMRGQEWLSSTPQRVWLYKAFGWDMPTMVHLPTILDPSGKGKLSKRKKKMPDGRQMLTYVHEFRQAGYLPEAMFNFLTLVGWSYDGEHEFFGRDELIRHFVLDKISKSPSAFAYDKLDHMNATYLRELGTNDLAGRLMAVYRAAGIEADIIRVIKIVPLVRERLHTTLDVLPLTDFFFGDIDYDVELLIQKKMDKEMTLKTLQAAEKVLVELDPFSEDKIDPALRTLNDELGLKVRQTLGCIRIACTGKKVAPPLFGTLDILGRDVAVSRLQEAQKKLANI